MIVASTICPTLARYPDRERCLSKRANRLSMARARTRLSRNSQIVLASGTLSERPSPRCQSALNILCRNPLQQPHKRKPVLNDELGLVVGEIIERLEHQDLDHQHRRERRTPAL